jgi:hypothetical protein
MSSSRFFVHLSLSLALLVAGASAQNSSSADHVKSQQAVEAYGKLPLAFEANRGQTDKQVRFLSRGEGYTAFLTDSEAVMVLQDGSKPQGVSSGNKIEPKEAPDPGYSSILRMKIEGASPNPKVSALDELEGRSNYFIGNDPKKWTSDVPLYKKVRFQSVYPGIDLLYYGTQGQLEYDFVIAPHADPEKIKVAFSGAEHMAIDKNGDLQINVGSGQVTFHKPVVRQDKDGVATPVSGTFRISNGKEVSFDLGQYDRSRELVIDPSLVYATYLSGNTYDQAQAIAVDNSGNAYITGWTQSTNFPTTSGSYQTTNAGTYDVFITKLNTTGSALVYSTYLGGSSYDFSYGIAVDSVGNAYVTGNTQSLNFPTTSGAFQQCSETNGFGFVSKLNSSGSELVYSTCIGSYVYAQSIAVDSSGSAYITGYTEGSIPVTPGAFQMFPGGSQDAFVTKFTPDGTGLAYSTFLGGNGDDYGQGIAVDSSGNAYVVGTTTSQNFPITSGSFQTTFRGYSDVFVTKLNETGSALVYSTYLGGYLYNYGYAIAVDGTGAAYVGGQTYWTADGFPITSGAYRTNYSGAFLTKLAPGGSALDYSTYLGDGSSSWEVNTLAIDSSGNAYVVQGQGNGCCGYLETISTDGSTLLSETYEPDVYLTGIAVDSSGASYAAGFAYYGSGFETTPGAFQTSPQNTSASGVVLKLAPFAVPVASLSNTSLNFGSQVVNTTSNAVVVTLTNHGDASLAISGIVASGDYAETSNCGSSLGSSLSCTISITFTPTLVGTRTGSVTITDNNNGTAGSTQSISMSGVGVAPIASLSTNSLTFGSQAVGTVSAAQNVTLSNTGNATLTIYGIVPTGDFSDTNNCSASVAPSGSCTISVKFAPTAAGTRTGSIAISDNAAGSPQYINLTGMGTGGSPIATLSTNSLTFAGQAVGTTSSAQSVTLSNTGTGSLNISSIASSGDYAQTNNCPASLAASANCTISATFTPTTTGTRSGTVTIIDNASSSPQTVGLTGTGLAPAVSLSATSLTFSGQQVGTSSSAQSVTLTNTGTATLTVISIVAAGDFGQTNNCGTSVAAGANCAIAITFAPEALGLRLGSVAITDNASGSPQSIALQGTGVASFVSLSATTLSFGNQVLSTTSAAQTVTLTNTGTGTLLNISFSTTGDFAQTNNCSSSLGAGLSCTISVTYTPTMLGNEIGSISISDSAAGSPQQITLSGTGVPAIAVSPTALSFTLQLVDTTSATQTVTLTNYQTVAVNVGGISISGPFTETDNCANTQVAAGGTCSISVAFVPTANGSATGTLVISDSISGSSPTVQLAGTSSGIVPNGFVGVSSMGIPRAQHQATLLTTGKVLITGGASTTEAQLYNPTTTSFTPIASPMSTARYWHVSHQIAGGNVLVAGGADANGNYLASADLYNYATNTFSPTGSMTTPRALPTATYLSGQGELLVTGGKNSTGPLASAEFYKGTTGTFSLTTGSMYTPRYNHVAAALSGGTVLITGGRCDPETTPSCASDVGISAEIYTPSTGTFTRLTNNMNVSRYLHTAITLSDGTVLIAGGCGSCLSSNGTVVTAEIYNPTTQTFTPTATAMVGGSVWGHRATPLGLDTSTTNQVLITGGYNNLEGPVEAEAQLYTVATQTFTAVGNMTTPRAFHTATPIAAGVVIVTGGCPVTSEGDLYFCPQPLASAETFVQTLTVTTSSTSLSFGTQLVGTTSSPQNVTITNTGKAQVDVASVGITGDFSVQTNGCQSAIQPGNSCTLGIVFVPTAIGSLSGALTITDNATGSPQTVALSGTGTTTTTTSLTSSLNPSTYGQAVTFTAVVVPAASGTPTGTVQFAIDGSAFGSPVTLVSGSATSGSISTLAEGTHTVTAVYSGATDFVTSTGTLNGGQVVNQASTTTTVASSLNPSTYGQAVTFTATITPQYGGQASGTVTFKDGSTTLGSAAVSSNAASLTTSSLAAGTHSITAVYSGTSNFTGSTSNTLSQVVTAQTATTTKLVSSINPSVSGKPVSFTASVSSLAGTPTGKIEFLNGKTILATVTLTSGSAKYTTSKLPAGSNSITAVYEGDSEYNGSTSPAVNQIVLVATTTTLSSSPNPSTYGQAVVFTAKVSSSSGAPPNGETVSFMKGTTVLGTKALSGGSVSFTTSTLKVGTNAITAVYAGDPNFAGSKSKAVKQVVQ